MKGFDIVLWDQLSPRVWSWGLGVKESNFPFSHPLQIFQSVLQVKLESREDGEQVYNDWDQCSRKLWVPRSKPDSYSALFSQRLPPKPQLRPSVWVAIYALLIINVILSMFDILYDYNEVKCCCFLFFVCVFLRKEKELCNSTHSLKHIYLPYRSGLEIAVCVEWSFKETIILTFFLLFLLDLLDQAEEEIMTDETLY